MANLFKSHFPIKPVLDGEVEPMQCDGVEEEGGVGWVEEGMREVAVLEGEGRLGKENLLLRPKPFWSS